LPRRKSLFVVVFIINFIKGKRADRKKTGLVSLQSLISRNKGPNLVPPLDGATVQPKSPGRFLVASCFGINGSTVILRKNAE